MSTLSKETKKRRRGVTNREGGGEKRDLQEKLHLLSGKRRGKEERQGKILVLEKGLSKTILNPQGGRVQGGNSSQRERTPQSPAWKRGPPEYSRSAAHESPREPDRF